jgi:F-type H+-transporting ATPase subunit epsilon
VANTQVEVVTPIRTLYSGEAEMVVCRSVEGEIAFLANHMPYLGVLEPGLVRLVNPPERAGDTGGAGAAGVGAEGEIRIAVHGGFVEVRDNRVIMLADVAELAGEIDVERARRAEAEAERQALATEEGNTAAEAALRRAQVRLEVASHS